MTYVPRAYDWHPAATAPRDGRDIRVRCEQRRGRVTTRKATWHAKAQAWIDTYNRPVTFEVWTEYVPLRQRASDKTLLTRHFSPPSS